MKIHIKGQFSKRSTHFHIEFPFTAVLDGRIGGSCSGNWAVEVFAISFLHCLSDHTFEAVEVVPLEDSALPKGILTSSLPGVFSTTRFMATPSVACRIFPLPTKTQKNKHVQQIPEENKTYEPFRLILKACLSTFGAPTASPRWFHHLRFLRWTPLAAGRASTSGDSEIKIIWVGGRIANLLEVGNKFHFGTKCLSLRAEQQKTETNHQ